MSEFHVSIRTFDGSWFSVICTDERALTEMLLLFRDDTRFDNFKVIKLSGTSDGDDDYEV